MAWRAPLYTLEVYRFSPNAIKLKSLSLILTDSLPRYDVEMYADDATESGPRFSGPIGLDGLYRKGEPTCPEALATRRVNAVKGTWQDDHIFVVDRLVLGEEQPAEEWRLTFDGEKLNRILAETAGSVIKLVITT